MKKKIFLICISAILLAALSSCGETVSVTPPDDTGSAEVSDSTAVSTDATAQNTQTSEYVPATESAPVTENTAQTEETTKRPPEIQPEISLPEPDDSTVSPSHAEAIKYLDEDMSAYAMLGQYKGITVFINEKAAVSAEDIDARIESDIAAHVTEGEHDLTSPAEMNDRVNINCTGYVDGEVIDGGVLADFDLLLGSDTMIDGLERGICGMRGGDIRDIEIVFPQSPMYADYSGKAAKFTVTLNYIHTYIVPEVTDEFVKEKFGYDDVETYRTALLAELSQEHSEKLAELKAEGAFTTVMANSYVFAYPDGLCHSYIERDTAYYKNLAAYYGYEYEDFLYQMYGLSAEEAEKIIVQSAANSAAQDIVFYSIVQAEGYTVSDEEYLSEQKSYVGSYGYETVDEFADETGVDKAELEAMLTTQILWRKVITGIVDEADFVFVKS